MIMIESSAEQHLKVRFRALVRFEDDVPDLPGSISTASG